MTIDPAFTLEIKPVYRFNASVNGDFYSYKQQTSKLRAIIYVVNLSL